MSWLRWKRYFRTSAKPSLVSSPESGYILAVDLQIVSPLGVVFSGPVQAVYAKSPLGWFGVLSGHTPAAFVLQSSPLRAITASGETRFQVEEGVLHVRENRITVVAREVRRG